MVLFRRNQSPLFCFSYSFSFSFLSAYDSSKVLEGKGKEKAEYEEASLKSWFSKMQIGKITIPMKCLGSRFCPIKFSNSTVVTSKCGYEQWVQIYWDWERGLTWQESCVIYDSFPWIVACKFQSMACLLVTTRQIL